MTVTPGIRLASDNVNDQKRVTTPAMAKELTSSYIVVGRTITGSQDPLATYKKSLSRFSRRIEMKKIIAKDLLDIKAVFLRPNEPIYLGKWY